METPALLLLIATVLPLASFAVLLFFGRRMGNPFAGYFGTAAISGSFACSVAATIFWLGGNHPGHPAPPLELASDETRQLRRTKPTVVWVICQTNPVVV